MGLNKETSKTTISILVIIIIALTIILIISLFQSKIRSDELIALNQANQESISEVPATTPDMKGSKTLEDILTKDIAVIPTMQDSVKGNTAWCATFQLVWNDMQDNLVGGNVKFSKPHEFVTNLNKQSFKEKNLPKEYYYKNWGVMGPELKQEIEKGIKEKFNETSDIIDLFDWPAQPVEGKYFFYSMLRRNFQFEQEFTILENGKFGKTENVKYFGINEETEESVRSQVEVMYYTDKDNFAVKLETKQGDKVVLVRNSKDSTFEKIFESAQKASDKYDGSYSFGLEDTLSIPNLKIDILKEYTELENIPFELKDGSEAMIDQAFQTIQMTLDNKGGSIKSEAGMGVMKAALIEEKPRHFEFTDKFTVFFTTEAEEPYFAANVENIELFK